MDYINAFWVGGLICALVQILMEKTKMLPGRIMVLLVCLGAVLGALQIYQPFMEFAGAGASVPLLGFGNTLWKGVKEAVDENGFIGIFMGGFKASACPATSTSRSSRPAWNTSPPDNRRVSRLIRHTGKELSGSFPFLFMPVMG